MKRNFVTRLLGHYGLFARRLKSLFYVYLGLVLAGFIVTDTALSIRSNADQLVYDGGNFDLAINYRFASPLPSDDVLIIDIDERSLALLAEDYGRWPWPRDIYAELLLALDDVGVEGVAVNLMFSDPDLNNPDEDELFNVVASELDNVVFPMTRLSSENDGLSQVTPSMIAGTKLEENYSEQGIALLFPHFSGTHDKLGINNLVIDDDGVVRRSEFRLKEEGFSLPTLHGRLATSINSELADAYETKTNQWLLNWRNKSGSYQRLSFVDVYRALIEGEEEEMTQQLAGKIVVIGASAPGIAIFKGTALGPLTDDNEIIATAIDDLLNDSALRPLGPWATAALSCAFLFAMVSLFVVGISAEKADAGFVILQSGAVVVTLLSVSYSTIAIDLSQLIFVGIIFFTVVKVHQKAEQSAKSGIGLFKPMPNSDFEVIKAICLTSERQHQIFSHIERHFAINNVYEVDELLNGKSILTEFLETNTYVLILTRQDKWKMFAKFLDGDYRHDIEHVSEIERSDEYMSDSVPQERELKVFLLDIAADCLEHFVRVCRRSAS